jgi:hypothetical protein
MEGEKIRGSRMTWGKEYKCRNRHTTAGRKCWGRRKRVHKRFARVAGVSCRVIWHSIPASTLINWIAVLRGASSGRRSQDERAGGQSWRLVSNDPLLRDVCPAPFSSPDLYPATYSWIIANVRCPGLNQIAVEDGLIRQLISRTPQTRASIDGSHAAYWERRPWI